MPTITSLGVASGMQLEDMVTALMDAERVPMEAIFNRRESAATTEITGVGLLKSALSNFEFGLDDYNTAADFTKRIASTGSFSHYTATADSTATSGVYGVEISQIADSQRLSSSGFSDGDTVVGTGSLTIEKSDGSESFTLTIDSENDTLSEIKDAINGANDNFGVSATIITVDDGSGGTESKLMLTASGVGTDNQLKITVDDDDENDTDTSGLSQLVYDTDGGTTNLTETQAAQDAIILIDGQQVTNKSSNIFENVITGVTITAKDAEPGETHDLNVSLSNNSVVSKVNSFVADFNDMMATLEGLSAYDEQLGPSGLLSGDTTLRTVKNAILRTVTNQVPELAGNYTSLSEIGVSFDDNDQLTVDSIKLNKVLDDDFESVSEIFTSENGITATLDSIITEYTKPSDGILDQKSSTLNDIIDDITESRIKLAESIEQRTATMRAKLQAMDLVVGRLNATQNFLDGQIELMREFHKKDG